MSYIISGSMQLVGDASGPSWANAVTTLTGAAGLVTSHATIKVDAGNAFRLTNGGGLDDFGGTSATSLTDANAFRLWMQNAGILHTTNTVFQFSAAAAAINVAKAGAATAGQPLTVQAGAAGAGSGLAGGAAYLLSGAKDGAGAEGTVHVGDDRAGVPVIIGYNSGTGAGAATFAGSPFYIWSAGGSGGGYIYALNTQFVNSSGNTLTVAPAGSLTFGASSTNISLSQAQSIAATAQPMSATAQAAKTGSGAVGGALNLAGGAGDAGTTSDGPVTVGSTLASVILKGNLTTNYRAPALPATIDGGVRDFQVWYSATGNIQLPAPRAGALYLVINSSAAGVVGTLVRFAAEKINNVAASFALGTPQGMHWIACDGVNWIVTPV